MKVILIYRPEAVVSDEPTPFEGIEILGVASNDDDAFELIQKLKDEQLLGYAEDKQWQFHIDEV